MNTFKQYFEAKGKIMKKDEKLENAYDSIRKQYSFTPNKTGVSAIDGVTLLHENKILKKMIRDFIEHVTGPDADYIEVEAAIENLKNQFNRLG